MDTARIRERARRATVCAIALAALLSSSTSRAHEDPSPVRVIGGLRLHEPSAPRAEMVGWALARYRAAHLAVPAVDVYFHSDPSGCRGNLGYTEGGRIDLCVRLAMEPGPQRIVLHELAHAWGGAHLGQETRTAFAAARSLAAWNDLGQPWKDRATEQAAEIVAWGLGDGTMSPMISGDRDPDRLADDFRLLTGVDPLHEIV